MSAKTPLLANLDMKENIALIKEVHHKMALKEAEAEARELLGLLGVGHIADLRVNRCSKEELFFAMILRAAMCDTKEILIRSPLQLLENLAKICEIIKQIQTLPLHKHITILDTYANAHHYKECGCPMTR